VPYLRAVVRSAVHVEQWRDTSYSPCCAGSCLGEEARVLRERKVVSKEVRQIVASWLKDNGYDGLYRSECCACLVGDLMPCGEPGTDCEAGYKKTCPPEGCDFCPAEGECEWHVGAGKDGSS
jgi:hypothetical protein